MTQASRSRPAALAFLIPSSGAALVWTLAATFGCSSAPTPKISAPAPAPAPINRSTPDEAAGSLRGFAIAAGGPTATPISSVGECSHPAFSPDGERALYVCRNRPQHKNAQVYEVRFRTRAERRITFHDGDDADPNYAPDGNRVIYASTTDEIKEEPYLSRSLKEKFAPASRARPAALPALEPLEIYVATPEGSDIRRLTRSPGYDAEASFETSGRKVAFASTRGTQGARSQIFLMSADGGGARPIAAGFDDDGAPAISPDGKRLAFVRRAPDADVAHVYVVDLRPGAKPRALTTYPALHLQPTWHTNGKDLIFASNRADRRGFDLWAIADDGSCLRRLTDAEGDETQPAISRDGARLMFAREKHGTKHVFSAAYVAPACGKDIP